MRYTFKCLSCKEESMLEFTINQYIEQVVFVCPKCGDTNMQRIIQVIPVIFKGEGFTKSIKSED